eukprot:PhM_4_TR16425/c0_g1_i1/m.36223/K00767/nadC, QPRT; nicotinate-nucleotide pyrophosphorylase (carboxylating)
MMLIPNTVLDAVAKEWIAHDISSFDVGGAVVGTGPAQATFFAKSIMVLAGFPFVEAVFRVLDCTVTWSVEEGTRLVATSKSRVPVGTVRGPIANILQGERTALEALTRCSAVATATRDLNDVARASGWKGRVAATRKTTPGSFRLVEKYGVIIGGGDTHRYNLSTCTMLKDNHIDATGSITTSVKKAKLVGGFTNKVEVECRSEQDAIEACRAGADIVMLDNFSPASLRDAVPRIKQQFPGAIVETSGGITKATLPSYAIDGVDIISVGALTHGYSFVDVSLKVVKQQAKL